MRDELSRKISAISMLCFFIVSFFVPSIMGAGILPPPVLIRPLEGEYLNTLTPTFEWEAVPGATEYGLYISRYADPWSVNELVFDSEEDIGISLAGTSFPLPAGFLKPGIRYRWNMRSFNGEAWGSFSTARIFSTSIANGGVRGIDVSHWQDEIDWDQVCNWRDNEGRRIEFAYVKATEGKSTDEWFTRNVEKIAIHNGGLLGTERLLVGVSHYVQPLLNDAVSEATYFVTVAGDYIKPGFLRPMLDFEAYGLGTKALNSEWIRQFISTVKQLTKGVEPIVYTLPSYAKDNLDDSVGEYDLWTTHPQKYSTSWLDIPYLPAPVDYFPEPGAYAWTSPIWDGWVIWQYGVTDYYNRNLPGTNMKDLYRSFAVDLDVFNGDRAALERSLISGWGESHNVAVVDDYYGSAVGYLSPSDYPNQVFFALSASQVSAETLANYDTVILFMFNPNLLNAVQKAAINDWVYKGGKLTIWDSDQVPQGSPWDYTWLPYPFSTSVPGQTGQTGKGLNVLEENQLSSSDPGSPYYIDVNALNSQTDAVGDANVLTAFSPAWHIDMMATNVLGETGPAHVYAAYGSGLIIYSALDWNYAGYNLATGAWLKKMLRQELKCSYLPFVAPPVPEEVGLEVEVTSDKSSYDLDETIEFEVTVANPTDETGINIVAYNVWFTVVPPDEIGLETPGVCYLLGDIPPGSSKSGVFKATAKKTGDNVEVIVNAYGEDRLLKTTIAGSGKCTLTVCEPEAPKPDWSFAVITDLHIGYGDKDYGDVGFEDGNSGESYSLTEMLESAVGTIIAERDYRSIRFVVVTGDISDTAEESEFLKAREILNRFNDPNGDGNKEDGIPYIPLIGNHDTSPYTQKNNPDERPLPGQIPGTDNLQTRATYGGDVTFNRVFWETNPTNYDLILDKIDDKFLRESVPVYSLALGHFLYLENYAFDYGGIGFVCLDAAERGPISAVYPSSSPIAKYWKQTKDFLIDQLKDHSGQELILFSHFPLYGLGGFLDTQDVASSIVKYGCTGTLNFAGHTHRNNVQDVWKYDWLGRPAQYAYTVIETEALSKIQFELLVEGYPSVKFSTDSGESIRIVQREGTEFDYSTTLKPRKQIDILWPNPFFTHTYASYPQPNSEITFTAHTIVYHGFKTSFRWDFGDGNFASGSSVTHSYSQEGEYDVTLSITLRNLLTGGETSQVVIGSIHVHSKHVISSLPPDLEATSLVTEEDLAKTPTNTYHPVLVTKKTPEEIAIGELGVHFEEAAEDIDLSNLVAQVDLEEGKSLIYMPSWPEEIEQYKLLFVPSTGTGTVYICSDATSLEEVSLEKADLIINVGETKDSITVATTFYNGKEYYLISGVTGTGGGELKDTIPPTTLLTIGEPKYVTGITYVTPGTPFNLTATDNPGGTGVALTVYRISNSTGYDSGWLTYTKPFNFTSLGDGNYTIAYNSTDNIGNVETPNTQEITLDNTPPTTKLTISKPNCVSDATYVTIDTSFTIEATDTGSGVKSIAYKIYNAIGYDSGWRAYVGSFNLSSLNDGSYTIAYNTTDNVGNVEPSKTVDVTLVRAKWLKQDALNQLNSLVPTGNKKVDGKIMEAAGKIKQSLGTTPWIDENHPNPKYGKQVFDKEKEAVLELMEILRGTDASQTVKNKIRTVIDELVGADKEIALIAIFDAKAKGSTDCRVIHEIKEADEEYSEALKAITKGNYDHAVEEFGHAWIRAQHAMKKAFGDVNADGKVNLIDCIILANAFGSCPGQPKWNPMADLNGDNKVDIRDCLIICANLWNVYD